MGDALVAHNPDTLACIQAQACPNAVGRNRERVVRGTEHALACALDMPSDAEPAAFGTFATRSTALAKGEHGEGRNVAH